MDRFFHSCRTERFLLPIRQLSQATLSASIFMCLSIKISANTHACERAFMLDLQDKPTMD